MSEPETDDDTFAAHQLLVESSLPLVFATYDEAVEEQVASPLVVLIDCEDELGGKIARAWLGDEVVDDAIAAEAPEIDPQADPDAEQTTVFARALAWDEAFPDLVEAFPYLAPALEAGPPEDGVFLVGVTAGGAAAFTAPWDARP